MGALVGEERVLDLQAAHIAQWEKELGQSLNRSQRLLAEAEMPADMRRFIELGPRTWQRAEALIRSAGVGGGTDRSNCSSNYSSSDSSGAPVWFSRSQIRLAAPIADPGKVICVGLNYLDHAIETNMQVPKTPVIFAKYASALIGPEDVIVHPGAGVTARVDYEAELVVVIGRRGKNIPASEAMAYVFGYTVMNDVSARDLQMESGQWLKGKTLDTFAPLGPAIVTADEVPDPHQLDIRCTVNGEVLQNSNTRNLICKIPDLIAYISRLATLEPGDIIATGTPAGVGMGRRPPVWLQPGDVVTVEVQNIGALTNRVTG